MIKYLYAFFTVYSCYATAGNLLCAPQNMVDRVYLELRNSDGYFPVYHDDCDEIEFSEVNMDDLNRMNRVDLFPDDCRSLIWAGENVTDNTMSKRLNQAYRDCLNRQSEQRELKDTFSRSTFTKSIPNLPSGKYVMDIYYFYTGAWQTYAKRYNEFTRTHAPGNSKEWDSQTVFSSYPISSESDPIKIWPFIYKEQYNMGSYEEAARSSARTLKRDYKGPNHVYYRRPGGVSVRVPSGGGMSDLANEWVSYDVDSVQFQFNDSHSLTFEDLKHFIKHQRQPYTYYGNPHDEAIRTIAKVILWIDASDLRSHCESLKLRKAGEVRVQEVVRQGLALIKMHALEGPSLISSLKSYFEETERGLDMAIETLDKNGTSMGPQAKILQAHLEALSILKKYPCLRGWTIDKILANPSGFSSTVNTCKSQKNISAPEAHILTSIFPNLQYENKRTLVSMKSFNEGLKSFSLRLTDADVQVEKINKDYERLKNWMTKKNWIQAKELLNECAFN